MKKIPHKMAMPKKKKSSSGANGTYFSFNDELGIKVSDMFEKAFKEAIALKLYENSGITPKFHGFTIVKQGCQNNLGIIMDHIVGIELMNSGISGNYHEQSKQLEVLNCIRGMLDKYSEKNGYELLIGDWHDENVMIRKEYNTVYYVNKINHNPVANVIRDYPNMFVRIDLGNIDYDKSNGSFC